MQDKQTNRKRFLIFIQGDKKDTFLEPRSINRICFFSMFSFISATLLSIVLKAPQSFTLAYLFFGILYTCYFLIARFWQKHQFVVWLMVISCCLYISFLWFFDGGISGPASIVSLLAVILVSPIPDNRQRRICISFIIILQGGLYYTQYFYPDMVNAHQSLENQFIANYLTFVFISMITATLVTYILKNLRKEREQTQKAKLQLKESEYLFRILAETTSTAIVLCQDQKFTYANPAAQRLYGYSLDELKMMRFQHLLSPEDKKKLQNIKSTENNGKTAHTGDEIQILSKSGQEKTVFLESSTIEYYGRPAELISMIDLTRLREAQTDLFNLQNYLSNIIDSMPSILVGVNENLNVTQWNRQAEKQTHILTEDALDNPLFKVIPRLKAEADKIKNAIAEQRIQENIRLSHEDGGQIYHEDITIYPLTESGFEGAVIRLDEVTEKVRLEEMVVQSEKMLSIGGLAAGMAHEINNPLAGILQNVQLAKNRLAKDIPANMEAAQNAGTSMEAIRQFMDERKIFNQLTNINTAGKRAAKIVDNMLSFAKKGVKKQPHSIASLLTKTIELAASDYNLKKQYDFQQIKIINEFNLGVPDVNCEENKIMQVFFNIITNATQAIYENNTPVQTPIFILRLSKVANMAQIEIEDNGPGMEEETRKRIFEPFFTTKDINKGTGLGLSLAYFIIVKDHKGEMEVESSPGNGAKFIIRLPFK